MNASVPKIAVFQLSGHIPQKFYQSIFGDHKRNFKKMSEDQEFGCEVCGCGCLLVPIVLYVAYRFVYGIVLFIKGLQTGIVFGASTSFHWIVEHYEIIILLMLLASFWFAKRYILLGLALILETSGNKGQNFIICPHCCRQLQEVYYKCPDCKREHLDLFPSLQHILYVRCACGRKLTTLKFLGKGDYEAFCPECKETFGKNVGKTQVVVTPIFGGRFAGKRTFLQASIQALRNVAKEGNWTFSYPYDEIQDNAEKTNERTTDACCIDFYEKKGVQDKRICLYTLTGDLFTVDHSSTEKVAYYGYMSGLIFIVDPFALPGVKEKRRRSGAHPPNNLLVCEENQEKCLNRLLNLLERKRVINSTDQNQREWDKIPCAVVVTKTDALNLNGYKEAVEQFVKRNPHLRKEASSCICRDWLNRLGESNLVNTLEAEFGECRYFFVSSFGKQTPETTGAFRPFGIEDPYRWLLEEIGNENNTSFYTIFMIICLSLISGALIVGIIITLATSH